MICKRTHRRKGFISTRKVVSAAFVTCLCLFAGTAAGQNFTNSPYSMYGIGELLLQSSPANTGMGNTGLAMSSNYFLNTMNPAAYTSIDSSNFILAMGMESKYGKFKTEIQKKEGNNFNFSYLALGWRINRWIATGFGLNPYSTTGYEINATARIDGTVPAIDYPLNITGSGNVNRAYLILAVSPLKNLSLGVKPSYLFGSLTQTQHHDLSYFGGNFGMFYQETNYFRNFLWEFGMQYKLDMNKHSLMVGALYTPGQNLIHGRDILVYDTNGNSHFDDEYDHWENDFQLPEKYEAGLAWTNNNNLTLALDAGIQLWSNYKYVFTSVELKDSPYLRTGMEFRPSSHFMDSYFKRIRYRAGFSYGLSYLRLKSYQLEEGVITIGFGLPLKNSLSSVDISLEGGQKGVIGSTTLMREHFLRLRVGFNLMDLWFQKRKFN